MTIDSRPLDYLAFFFGAAAAFFVVPQRLPHFAMTSSVGMDD